MLTSRMRRLSAAALTLTLVATAAACGDDGDGEAAGDGGGSIWVLLPDTATSDRWENDDRRYFSEAFEAAGLEEGDDFNIVNAEGDATTQQSQAEQAIADGASVIVLTSVDTGSGATIIEQAQEADVQVVEYDRFNTGGPGGAAYVSFDNVQVGATMAEAMEPAIDALGADTPQVVMLNGGEEDNNSFLFRAGYAETVEARVDAGDWGLVADQHVPGWDNAEAQTIMEQILVSANNEVDAVFAANDGLANSAINALDAAGIGPVPVSGQDATQAGMQNIALGTQTVSVYKPIQDEAGVAAAVALALRAGEDFEDAATSYESELASGGASVEIIGIDPESGEPTDAGDDGSVPYIALVPIGVTVDNMADTVIADGFRTVDEICTGEAASTEFCQQNA
ncbi:MAG TPA: substrate-binding domain-containing protein [Acidimicrobiales bacterium]